MYSHNAPNHGALTSPPPSTTKRSSLKRQLWQSLLTLALLGCAVGAAAQTALPHNIPDFSQDTSRPTVRSAQSGDWSVASTWQGGQLPTAGHVVQIDPGHVVTINNTTAAADTIAVHGTLRFDPLVDTRLTVTNLMVMGDHGMASMTQVGRLEVGTAANPIAAGRTADIVIANSPLGGGVSDPDQFGTGIINFGTFTMHGAAMGATFLRLAVEPRAGHTTLTLSAPVAGWRIGDRLVIPDTRHMKESETTGSGWINAQNQWEELTVQGISADGRVVTLSRALTYDHLGARDLNGVLDFLPHVGNLSRNASIRSQSATGTRGHVISVDTADTDIRYALFRDLGRTKYTPLNTTTNVIGRYPIHMHHNRGPRQTPANGYQFTLVGNAIDGGSVETQFKWGIAVHNSHYGLIQDNVVYNYNGSSIVTEDGSESFNVFDHNFALRGMGEPNNSVDEARSAMGTEATGFWFRGPNNYVKNNVAANFQNPTTEAAYGFVYQFIRLGNIATPNFKGADPAVTGEFTTRNGNNMPILQFENNEAYGAMQGGFTYWWVNSQDPQPYATAQESVIKDLKIWHVYNKAVYHYPSQKITFDGLIIRGTFDSSSRCCGNGVYGADYSTKAVIIRNSDIQGMDEGISFPEAGFGPEPNLTVETSYLRNDNNIQVPTNGSVNGCWMQNKLVVITNTRFAAPPGRSLRNIAMVRDVGYAPECLSKLDEARVYAYNGVATDNFQVYHTNTSVLPRPPSSCSPTTRPEISGLLCPIAALGPVAPTVTITASPASITSGQSAVLTWSSTNATSVSINQGIGTVAVSGTRSVSPTATTTYTVTATNSVGSVTATATVTLTTATPPLPTAALTASPTSIASGAAATLSWSTTNATSVSINQSIGTVATSGTRSVSPAASTTYTLTATNATGSVTATTTVTITTTATAHTKDRANSYDDAWQAGTSGWVANAQAILASGTGQVPGMVMWIGDSLTRDPALGAWAQGGAGKTAEDQMIAGWMHAGQSPQGIDSTDGFALATPYFCSARSFTVGDGLGSWHFMGSGMPADTNPTTARQKLLDCATYPNALNLTTMLTGLQKPQFAIPEVNLDAANPGSFPDFDAMVKLMISKGIVPIIITYTYRTDAAFNLLVDQYNAALIQYAQAKKLPLIDLNKEMLLRLPFSQWPGRFLSDGVHYTRGNSTYPSTSDPYANGGDPATHATGIALTYDGYGLKGWLGVQKMKEIKALVNDALAPAVPAATLTASPFSITQGQSSMLTWTTAGATSVSIDQGVGVVASSGTIAVAPAATTAYTLTATGAGGSATATSLVTVTTAVPPPPPPPPPSGTPTIVGSQVAGTFADASGHSAQSHLVYAANSGVWWLFTLTSAADGQGGANHIVKSFRSSGPDLATATWTPGPDSPGASVAAGFSPNGSMGAGRALGVAYINNNPADVLHAEVNMSYDGQDAVTGHIRAVLTGTSITWASWDYSVEPSATWAKPGTSVVGVSTGKYIHSAGPNLQQQVDANARKSNNADAGSAWTSGFSGVSVIDNSMINQVNSSAFAPLANNAMLAVYDNGGGQSCGYNCVPPGSATEPKLTNLGFKRSNANGSWPGVPIGSQGAGDGSVFGTTANINQNDWALVPVSTSSIFAFRARAAGNAIDGASYAAATNTWSAISPAPPAFGAGQAFKAGAGLFGATDGTQLWLFFINTDAANSVLHARFDGSSWTPWSAVPGTDAGTQTRGFIAGSPQVANNQVGLAWTEGTGPYTVAVTSLAVDAAPLPPLPTVTLSTSPASIIAGSASSLAWSSTNAASVSINQGVGTVAASGTTSVAPAATTTYTITATNAAGSAAATATVTVSAPPPPPPPPPTATLSVTPASIAPGGTATLSWTTMNATSISINQGVGTVAASGTRSVAPSATTTYTLTATNTAGTVTATATASVAQIGEGESFATVGLTAGWATFGQVVPQGIATGGLLVGTFPTQTDVKNRWPDGSIRFAIVSVNAPSSGNYPLYATSAAGGTLTSAPVDAAVSLSIGGTAYTATLPAAASADAWLSGPLVREDRHVVAPRSDSGVPHPFLRVNFDRRSFHDGQARVDVSVENLLDLTGATTVTYDVAISVDGQNVFTKTAVQHYYLTRWRQVFTAGSTPAAEVTPDLVPFNETRALPPYLPLVTNEVNTATGSAYEILQPGALIANMPDHGGRPELAPYPDWTARYLVHRNATQRGFVLANGDLSGSWPIHVREAEGGAASGVGAERYVSLDQRPTIWYDGRAQSTGVDYIHGTPLPIREYVSTTPGPGQSPLIPDNAHQPSLAYVPYLLTGDRYYAEEMAFWANYSMLRTYNADGVRNSKGILQSNEVRGFGWALRNMVDAAAYYPDSSPMKAYLSQKVANNLQWLDAYANSQDPITNPFTVLWLNKRPEGAQYRGLWEENYLAYAIDRAWQQGFSGGRAHRDAIAKFQVLLFNSEPAYSRSAAAPSVVGVGTPSTGGFVFHRTMSEIWNATQDQTRPFAGYYGPEARLNLMIGMENGWAGAQDAYDYLWPFLAVQPVWGTVADLGQRAGWALDFYPGAQPPAPPPPTAVPAALASPAPGTVLTSTTQAFAWSAGTGVTSYRLDVGTTVGSSGLFAGAASTNLSATVSGLPNDGSAIWVRLSSQINGAWQSADYTFTAMTATPPPPPTDGIAVGQTITANGTGTLTTDALGASAAGDILMAFAASSGPKANRQALTVTGGGLTWKRALRANVQAGSSEIWWASVVAPVSGIRVTSTQSRAGFDQSLTVVTFKGAKGIGNVVQANAMYEPPHIVLTTTRAGSLVYAVGNDWDGAVARTLGPNQVKVHEWVDTRIADTFWVQTFTSKVPYAGTTVELNATEPRLNRWNLAAIEIVK